jgi:hypothetical protein
LPSQSVEDLRKALADAEAAETAGGPLSTSPNPVPLELSTQPVVDTSGMPGGVDSAPVTQPVSVEDPAMQPGGAAANTPAAAAPPAATEPLLERVEDGAETDALDIIGELKKGESITDVANKLLDQTGLVSIVKAIRDLI